MSPSNSSNQLSALASEHPYRFKNFMDFGNLNNVQVLENCSIFIDRF